MTPGYFDKEGNSISIEKWVSLYSDHSYKVLKQDQVGPYFISTVWLGLDHNFQDPDQILIFETMVFPDKYSGIDVEVERYSTVIEALEGHENCVKRYKNL